MFDEECMGTGDVLALDEAVDALGLVDVVGEDAPALGSDWDGFIVPTKPLKDPRGLPLLTDALLEAGFSSRAIGKILRGNVMRVLDEA